ncbi:MAG TPA: septum formation initiator family protein [Patescibacteria group bacterium]|nr:septum formation initiator family protein [Patescibacteria group bacterium]
MIRNRLVKVIIVIIGIGLIISLSRNIYRLIKAGDQVRSAQEYLEELEKEHQALLEKKGYYQSEEFVEQEARNRLNLGKEGETVVILPPNVGQNETNLPEKALGLPNWQKWLRLFF